VLDALEQASRRLEEVALEPEPLSPEERSLKPRPAGTSRGVARARRG